MRPDNYSYVLRLCLGTMVRNAMMGHIHWYKSPLGNVHICIVHDGKVDVSIINSMIVSCKKNSHIVYAPVLLQSYTFTT